MQVQTGEWRRYGFGGPPEPWDHGARRDLDRLATSYYVDVLESRRRLLNDGADATQTQGRMVEVLFSEATHHKHEIDFALRHWTTPAERAWVEGRLGALMRISRRLRSLVAEGAER